MGGQACGLPLGGYGSEGMVMTHRRLYQCDCGGRMINKQGEGVEGDVVCYKECRSCGRLGFFSLQFRSGAGWLYWKPVEQEQGIRALFGYGASLPKARSR